KWIGLVTGLIVFVVSITGCINVFSDELKLFFYHKRYYVDENSAREFLPFTQLRETAQKTLNPDVKISRVEVYPGHNRTWVFRASSANKNAFGYWKQYKYYYRVYINPYSGEVVFVENTKNEFFQLILNLHMNLLLGDKVGTMITGISVLCFSILLISGLILWFPRRFTFKAFKKGLTLKRGVGLKRLNYDFHNVFGFYMLIPALIIALTGLVFAFAWADNSMQFLANGAKKTEKREIPKSAPSNGYPAEPTNKAVAAMLKKHPNADVFSIRFREKNTDPLDVQVRLAENRTHLFEWYYFDRTTAKLLMHYNDRNVIGGEKFRSMNYDLHTGAFAGIPTKILAIFICLICAAMPVTGFFMWYNKLAGQKKSKNRGSKPFNSL
ncbi:MAG: PepSY domain-containing protein, partial [Chryseobacterium sp.]